MPLRMVALLLATAWHAHAQVTGTGTAPPVAPVPPPPPSSATQQNGYLTLTLQSSRGSTRQLAYRFPHPNIPGAVMHALFSNRDKVIEAPLSIAGKFYGDPRDRQFLLSAGCTMEELAKETDAMKGKILVVVRGSCPFSTKAENAAAAGAVGLVVVDNCSPMMEVNTNCDAKNAPIMSIEAGKAMDSAVYDMVALAVTEQVGISLLTLAMLDAGNVMATIEKNDHPARLTVASDATPQPGVPPHPPRTDDDGYDDKHRNSTSMFGTFVLFSGCITIGMLVVMSLVQFRQNRRRLQRQVREANEREQASEVDFRRVLDALPLVPFKPDEADDDEPVCCVCLDTLHRGDLLRRLPCKHEFHGDCVDPWLKSNTTCPLCKDDVYVALGVHDEAATDSDDTVVVVVDGGSNAPAEGDGEYLEVTDRLGGTDASPLTGSGAGAGPERSMAMPAPPREGGGGSDTVVSVSTL